MKRITPEDVVDAYIATGKYPVCRRWSSRDGKGGCALTVVGKSRGLSDKPPRDVAEAFYAESLGLNGWYVAGFADGFDRTKKQRESDYIQDRQNWQAGYDDGKAARAAVTAHFARATSPTEPTCATEPIAVGR